MRKVSFFVSLFLCLGVSAQAVEVGGVFKFNIPDRPVGTPEQHGVALAIQNRLGSEAYQDLKKDSLRRCPKITRALYGIFERLIEANQLAAFAHNGSPGLRLEAKCLNVSPDGTGQGSSASTFGIGIAAYHFLTASSEDEIAFILAHEMAHLILGHNELSGADSSHPIEQLEDEADRLGAIIAANADYDPLASYYSFCNQVKLKNSIPKQVPCFLLTSLSQDGYHGSFGKRFNRVKETLKTYGYAFPSFSYRWTHELEEARQETLAIKKSIDKD